MFAVRQFITKSKEEYSIFEMKEVSEIDLNYFGIAICGSKKKVIIKTKHRQPLRAGRAYEASSTEGIMCSGSISLMNMLMVDFQNRKREFGLLKAVGATQKQLNLIALVAVMGGIYLIFVAYAKVELKKAEILPAIREE